MVEVIDMERWRQRRSRSSGQDTTPEQRATLRRQNEELERQQSEALAMEMREKLGDAKLQPADREVLASNLWRFIQKARAYGVMKRQITHRAGLGDGASSKRLDLYTLPEGFKAAVREKRLDKLAKKSRRYLQLVEATAELANWKKDKAVLELISGSSLDAASRNEGTTDVPTEYIRLNGLLQKLCRWAVHNSDIEQCWELAEKQFITGCVDHWYKNEEEHDLNGFEAPSVRLGYLKGDVISSGDNVPDFSPLNAEIRDQSGQTYPTRVIVGASVHLCLARWSRVPSLRPFFGFAPALLHLPPDDRHSYRLPPGLNNTTVIENFTVNETGESACQLVAQHDGVEIGVTAEEVRRRGAFNYLMEFDVYRREISEYHWRYFWTVLEASAHSLYEIFGQAEPFLIRGEWLNFGDAPTECLETAAAALQRALTAPEEVLWRAQRPVSRSDQIPSEPEGGWPRSPIGPVEELWINAMSWRHSLGHFIEKLQTQARDATLRAMAVYDLTPPSSDAKGQRD